MVPAAKSRLLLWISRVTALVSVVALLLVAPLCYCPRYYLALSAAGFVPLICGPRLYRWFGGAFIVAALGFAIGEHRAEIWQRQQIEHTRAEVEAHQ